MANIDFEKFVCDLMDDNYKNEHTADIRLMLNRALGAQGLVYDSGKIVKKGYEVGDCVIENDEPCELEGNIKRWTIEEAKCGYVLYNFEGCGVAAVHLIRGWEDVGGTKTLCSMCTYRIKDDRIISGGLGAIWWHGVKEEFVPANSEQRKMLFEKMDSEGMIWDNDKKVLITQTPFECAVAKLICNDLLDYELKADTIKETVDKLLNLAREQLIEMAEESLNETRGSMCLEDLAAYENGVKAGMALAEDKIPHWKPIKAGERLKEDSFLMSEDGSKSHKLPTISGVLVGRDCYYLPCKDLRKLPKLEDGKG